MISPKSLLRVLRSCDEGGRGNQFSEFHGLPRQAFSPPRHDGDFYGCLFALSVEADADTHLPFPVSTTNWQSSPLQVVSSQLEPQILQLVSAFHWHTGWPGVV